MAGKNRHLRVVAIRQESFVSGSPAIPVPPLAAIADAVLKATVGKSLHHRPQNALGLSTSPQLIQSLNVVVGVRRPCSAVLENAKGVAPAVLFRGTQHAGNIIRFRDRN